MKISEEILRICQDIKLAGGNAFFVGGYVRDGILGLESKDIDIEVFSLDEDKLQEILSKYGKCDAVGKSYGVIKLRTKEDHYDFSIPRRETKTGQKHTDFEITTDPGMSLEAAALRRDFTIGAIYYDVLKGQYCDPYGGIDDLKNKRLRPTSEKYKEDPLRILRAMQFCSRFSMVATQETIQYSIEIKDQLQHISKERIEEEWKKFFRKSQKPSLGIEFLENIGMFSSLVSEQRISEPNKRRLDTIVAYNNEKLTLGCFCYGIPVKDAAVFLQTNGYHSKMKECLELSFYMKETIVVEDLRGISIDSRNSIDDIITIRNNPHDSHLKEYSTKHNILYKKPKNVIPNGNDILPYFGNTPGKHIADIILLLENLYCFGKYNTKEEGLVILENLFTDVTPSFPH